MNQRSDNPSEREAPASAASGAGQQHGRRQVTSDALLQGHKTVEITHNGETYRLQATRLGKLILTK
jgi:hemin uptake protein HemP